VDLNLKGKIAVVTGGSRDIGREIALTLAAEGAAVAVNYLHSAVAANAVVHQIRSIGGTARAYQADVCEFAAVKAMMDAIVTDFGGLGIVVNNAGLGIPRKFAETTEKEWKSQIDTGLYGAIHTAHAALPHLQNDGDGRIISIVGDSSRVGESGLAVAAAARGGVISLMKSLAREFGHARISVNTVSLGLVETTPTQTFIDTHGEKLLKLYPLRRLGLPADIAPIVALLASPKGSWITGQVISINGGFSMI
jgi:NAD(P)-dependent dehydrogenase (short-subunit alcohol dehydrogenase family)